MKTKKVRVNYKGENSLLRLSVANLTKVLIQKETEESDTIRNLQKSYDTKHATVINLLQEIEGYKAIEAKYKYEVISLTKELLNAKMMIVIKDMCLGLMAHEIERLKETSVKLS